MDTTATHPWVGSYPPGVGARHQVTAPCLTESWRSRVAFNPARTAIAYFDGQLSALEVDGLSDALAVALAGRGVSHGDRIGIQLQNTPQYALSLLALWKLGAIGVLLNPMYQGRELRHLLDDSGARGLIVDDTLYAGAAATTQGSTVEWIITTSGQEFQTRNDPRIFTGGDGGQTSPDGDLVTLLREYAGQVPPTADLTQDDVALLTYTSGTTGPPKGAMNTHGNILNVAETTALWMGIEPGDAILAVAPMFHITGAVIDAVTPLLHDTTLVLANRTHPEVVVEAFREHSVTCTTGSITVFNALERVGDAVAEHFASTKTLYSGGAPIPPSTVEKFEQRFGQYIHNIFGMTETTSAVIAVPPGTRAPVDPSSGSLSIGLPMPNIDARVLGPDGSPLPPGEQGELELAGPQIVPGYWNNPEATEHAMPGGRLRTGDVAVIDESGWVYIVDRLKDQINVSGYKVWPREVEDVLYEHPAVFEAAVVGAPDEYRGETVVAYVTVRAGTEVTGQDIIDFAQTRLAAYKYPREVHIIDDLPKTQTGKIRRRALRDATKKGQS